MNVNKGYLTDDNLNLLFEALSSDKPSIIIKENEDYFFKLVPELKKCKGFNQNNPWHVYDVYEHILHVINGVPNNLVSRLTAFFHDLGKPSSYTEDEKGIGHFYGHWEKSQKIFLEFANKYNFDKDLTKLVSNLVFYHDINLDMASEVEITDMLNILGVDGIKLLYNQKRSDLLAQSSIHHDLLSTYDKQEKALIKMLTNKDSYRK